MPQTLIRSRRQRWVTLLAVAVQIPGWTAVAGAYSLAVPLFGVVSPITWATTWTAWLYVIATPCLAAAALAITRHRALTALMASIAVLACAALRIVGTIESNPSDHFHRYRTDLAELATTHPCDTTTDTVQLPRHMRWLSIDGKAHPRHSFVNGTPDAGQCVLYLPARQDWRAETAVGFGYFPEPPTPRTFIATAAGDMDAPAYELGDGWWWIE